MTTWLKALALSTLAVFAPVKAVLVTVLVLVLLDTITGVMAARKRGERITSAGLRRSVSKLLAFELALIAGHLLERFLLVGAGIPVVSLLAAAIGVVEAKSVLENCDTISGGSVFKSIIGRLGSTNDRKPE